MNKVIQALAAGVVRNRGVASNKRHSYKYRLACDMQAVRYEDMLIEYANKIIERVP